jgi:hypothetical protein
MRSEFCIWIHWFDIIPDYLKNYLRADLCNYAWDKYGGLLNLSNRE